MVHRRRGLPLTTCLPPGASNCGTHPLPEAGCPPPEAGHPPPEAITTMNANAQRSAERSRATDATHVRKYPHIHSFTTNRTTLAQHNTTQHNTTHTCTHLHTHIYIHDSLNAKEICTPQTSETHMSRLHVFHLCEMCFLHFAKSLFPSLGDVFLHFAKSLFLTKKCLTFISTRFRKRPKRQKGETCANN